MGIKGLSQLEVQPFTICSFRDNGDDDRQVLSLLCVIAVVADLAVAAARAAPAVVQNNIRRLCSHYLGEDTVMHAVL